MTTKPQNAILYARFSPRRNAAQCESIETQDDLCRAYCDRQGYTIKATFEDRALSGSEEDRPGLWDAVNALKKRDVMVVYRLDRLARDVYLSELIYRAVRKKGATIEAVEGGGNGDSPEDEVLRGMLQVFSQYERKVTAARTKAAMLRHQATGRKMAAQPPYGQRIDPEAPYTIPERPGVPARPGRTLPDHEELAQIQRILRHRREGLSYRAIARELNRCKIPSRGEQWTHSIIGRILRREGVA